MQRGSAGGEEFVRWDRELDTASVGPTWLKDVRVARVVVDVIEEAESRDMCQVGAFVVMSNHVHLLLRPLVPGSTVMQWIKGVSALRANQVLGRSGARFWQQESYDHFVRTGPEHRRICDYIEQNPVKAGLVECVNDWVWCSAFVKAGTS